MAILHGLIGIVITICIATFAVLNRADVEVVLSPIHDSVTMPIYVVAFVFMVLGFVFGMLTTWLNMGSVRKEKRKQRKEIKILEKEVGRLKTADINVAAQESGVLSALPTK